MPQDSSTTDIALDLGISRRRVRQLIAAGTLVGGWAGEQHVVDGAVFEAFRRLERPPGRPLAARSAWAILEAVDPTGLCHPGTPHRHRARQRLTQRGLAAYLPRLRTRARRVALRRSLSTPEAWTPRHLLAAVGFLPSGVTTAPVHGLGRPCADLVEGYVRRAQAELLVPTASLEPAAQAAEADLVLHVVDGWWPFLHSTREAPPLVTAVDLLDWQEPRWAPAAAQLVAEHDRPPR